MSTAISGPEGPIDIERSPSRTAAALAYLIRYKTGEIDLSPTATRRHKNRQIVEAFPTDVSALEINELVVALPGKDAPPMDNYSLLPIMPSKFMAMSWAHRNSLRPARWDFNLPSGITVPPNSRSSYLDTSLAVGLVYKDRVVAVAGGGLDPAKRQSPLTITQIQGWEGPLYNRKAYRESGLHGGFLWRHTLVNAWLEIAKQNDLDALAIQSGQNNAWLRRSYALLSQLQKGYDDVALDMGFRYDPKSKDFIIDLE